MTIQLLITLKILTADLCFLLLRTSHGYLLPRTELNCKWLHTELAADIPRVALYSLSTNSTENISRGCYRCVVTNCRRDVFNSVLHSNEQGVTQERAINTRTSIVACVSRFLCFNSSRMAQIRHTVLRVFDRLHP
jgi:hypothetical protein